MCDTALALPLPLPYTATANTALLEHPDKTNPQFRAKMLITEEKEIQKRAC